jgi:hypothetical protein
VLVPLNISLVEINSGYDVPDVPRGVLAGLFDDVHGETTYTVRRTPPARRNRARNRPAPIADPPHRGGKLREALEGRRE